MNRRLMPYYLLVALVMMCLGGIFTLLGELRDELGFEEWELGVMVGAGFFTAFVANVTLSRFSDRGHSAAMIRLGLVGLAAGMAIMAIASSYVWYLSARMLLGIGAGTLTPAVRRIVVVSDPSRVGRNLGQLGSFDIGGFLIGPIVAGALAHFFSFRAPFAAFTIVTLLFVPVVARLPADEGDTTTEKKVIGRLLEQPGIRAMLWVAIGWYAMIGVFEAVWAVMLTDRGAETWLIALTFTIVMVPMLFLAPMGGELAQRHGPLRIAMLGILGVAPAVASYGFIEHLGWLTLIATIQGSFDAVVFPATQVGAAMASDDELAASAQGLQGATLQITAGIVAVMAGFAYGPLGPKGIFLGASALMLAGVVGAFTVSKPLRATSHPLINGDPSRRSATGSGADVDAAAAVSAQQ
jgi:MFS family permease